MSLAGRIAMVTGASRGIGREVALGYAHAGAHVILAARDEARLAAVAGEIDDVSATSDVVPLDVSDAAAVRDAIDGVVARHGRLDVLCNNAGISTARGHVADVSPQAFAGVQAVNLIGLFACCHAALPHMAAAVYGRIVNVSSGAAIMCNPGESAYAASKAAVNALTIAMAKEVEASNVLINAMSPGSVKTDMNPTSDVPPSEAVPTAVWLASLPDGGPTGRFYRFMQELPMLPDIDLDWKSR